MPEGHRRGTGLVVLSLCRAAAMIRAACGNVRLPGCCQVSVSSNCIEPLESRTLLSTSWFVSPGGSDNNPGTAAAPFHTIQHAADVAQAGDYVEIRAGVYHEDVVPKHSGTATAPIVFEAYNNESVTITGADRVSGFTSYRGAIYSASMPWDLGEGNNQVFVDGQMINEARWPNTSLDVSHPTLERVQSVSLSGSYATIYDTSLNQTSGFWNGAIIHIGPGQAWTSQTGTVVSSSPGQITFKYEPLDKYEWPKAGNSFYLTGTFKALDTAAEWYRDPTGALYIQTPASDNPNGHDIEAKRRDYAFDVSNQSYITIQNVNIFAATINSNGGSRGLIVNHINAKYTGQFLTTPDGWHIPGNTGIMLNGPSSILENSVVQFSAGDGVIVQGAGSRVTNNVIHDIDYNGVDAAAIRVPASGVEVDHNSIYNAGRSGIVHSGSGLKILYNAITAVGLQTTEAGGIYVVNANGGGSEIAYNSIWGFHSGGFGQSGLFFDNNANNYNVHNNNVSNVDIALKMNGYARNIIVWNNTLSGSWYSVFGDYKGDWGGSKLTNNALPNTATFGSGAYSSNNSNSAASGIGSGSFTSGASSSVIQVSNTPPPLSGGQSGSTGSSSSSSSGGSASSGTGSSSDTGSQTPPPDTNGGDPSPGSVVGPLLASQTPAGTGTNGTSGSATVPPTTPDGWTALIAADRQNIQTVQQQSVQHIQDLNDTLRSDTVAYRAALLELGKASRQKDDPGKTATRVGLSNKVALLKLAMTSDRAAISNYRKSIPTALAAARQQLASDLKAMRQAQRDAGN